jgi:hypothetical protein
MFVRDFANFYNTQSVCCEGFVKVACGVAKKWARREIPDSFLYIFSLFNYEPLFLYPAGKIF